MKYTLAIAAVLVAATCGNVMAEEGQVSQTQLAELGLPGMSMLSDAQGREIRGQGFVFAISTSEAELFGAENESTVVAFGRREAGAFSGASAEVEVEGSFGGFGGGGFFSFEAEVSSSGYAYGFAR